ncbi:hypothetical protein D3C80_1883550 [compost metagenome]
MSIRSVALCYLFAGDEKTFIWPKGALCMPTFTAINGELLSQISSITMVLPMPSLSAATSR